MTRTTLERRILDALADGEARTLPQVLDALGEGEADPSSMLGAAVRSELDAMTDRKVLEMRLPHWRRSNASLAAAALARASNASQQGDAGDARRRAARENGKLGGRPRRARDASK